MDIKPLISGIATAMSVASYVPYLIGMYRGETKPHIFSWLIWSLLMGIGCAVQVASDAGPGAWLAGVTSLMTLSFAMYALKNGEKNITRGDCSAFIAALAAIPVWILTRQPVWAAFLVSAIDLMAFYPTFRKAWTRPREEVLMTYLMCGIAFGLTIFAMDSHSFATCLYPATVAASNGCFCAMVIWRRGIPAV